MSELPALTGGAVSAWLLDVDDTLLDTATAMLAAAPGAVAEVSGSGLNAQDAQRVGEAYCQDSDGAFHRYARGEISLQRSRGERLISAYHACGLRPPQEADDLDRWGAGFESVFAPRFIAQQRVFPDVEPALELALSQGIRVGLLTNASESLTRAKLRATPLAHFPFVCVVTRDTLGFGKPDARVFTHAASSLVPDFPRESVLYVGDSWETDVLPAQAAGLIGVLIDRDQAAMEGGIRPNSGRGASAQAVIRSLTDLLADR